MNDFTRNAFCGSVGGSNPPPKPLSFPFALEQCRFSNRPMTERQKQAFSDWIIQNFQMEMLSGRVFAGTFLFVEGVKQFEGQKAYHHFFRAVNRRLYGKAMERHTEIRAFKHVAVMEGGGLSGKQVHYHSLFENPNDRGFSDEAFCDLLKTEWQNLRTSMKDQNRATKIIKVYDLNGSVDYQSKNQTKDRSNGQSMLDMVDISTLRL